MRKNMTLIISVSLLVGSAGLSLAADVSTHALGSNLRLPDTGQTQCYDTGGVLMTCPVPGAQDGSYKSVATAPSYKDNLNGTITDNRTGLMWEQNPFAVAGTVGSLPWLTALSACETGIGGSGTFAGYSDWRLPNVRELMSIVDYSLQSPSINPLFISQTGDYWTSTTDVAATTTGWFVSFVGGSVGTTVKTNSLFVRCVRGVW